MPVPLIAPATQKRIDELMALCDQLEGRATSARRGATNWWQPACTASALTHGLGGGRNGTDSRRLLEAVLHEALAA